VKIGLPVQKLLTFLFPIETHGKGGFAPFWGQKIFSKIFDPQKALPWPKPVLLTYYA
jgi:hypothetical protein